MTHTEQNTTNVITILCFISFHFTLFIVLLFCPLCVMQYNYFYQRWFLWVHCSSSTIALFDARICLHVRIFRQSIRKSALIRYELHDHSKIDLWEIKRALSGQLVALFRKLEITFYVERRCAVCFDLATFGPLEFPRTLVEISGLSKKPSLGTSALRQS